MPKEQQKAQQKAKKKGPMKKEPMKQPPATDEDREGLDDNGNPLDDASKDQNGGKRPNSKKYKSVFMEGVQGVTPFHQEPQLTNWQKIVQRLCHFKE